MIWQMQIMLAENKSGKHIDKEEIKKALSLYDQKWKEWEQLKKQHPSCPTLYSDDIAVNCGPPFQESVTLLKNSIEKEK